MTTPSAGVSPSSAGNPKPAAGADEVLVTLSLGRQLCGIDVGIVRDVLGGQTITHIPLAQAEVAGSLNLRGRIVTAIDLRRRLGLDSPGEGARQMSVVVDLGGELFSLLVDDVGEVMTLPGSRREELPLTLDPLWRRLAHSVYRLDGSLMVALDVGRLLDLDASLRH